MARYKAILLDFYGTLVQEDDPVLETIIQQIGALTPVENAVADIRRRWWHLMGQMCLDAHGDNFLTQREIELRSLQQVLDEFKVDLDPVELCAPIFRNWQSPQPYPDAAAFVRALDLPICIVSNIDDDDIKSAIRVNGWSFPMIVTSEGCRAYKPRPEMFEAALRLLDVGPAEVLHAGDSLGSDVAGAQRCGIDVAWLNRRSRPLPSIPPTVVALSFVDVLSWIDP